MTLLEEAEEAVLERLVARLDRVDPTAALDDAAHEVGDAIHRDAPDDDPLALGLELSK